MTDCKRISSGEGGRGNTHLVQNLEISADLMIDTARTRAVSKENFSFELACSRRSNSGARAKNEANERAGKNGGRLVLFPRLPSFFPALSLAFFFARTPLSERLEQATFELTSQHSFNCASSHKTFILSLAW